MIRSEIYEGLRGAKSVYEKIFSTLKNGIEARMQMENKNSRMHTTTVSIFAANRRPRKISALATAAITKAYANGVPPKNGDKS